MKVIVTDFDGNTHALEGLDGWRVMEVIRDYGLPIKADCGGACCCATCHVYVDPAWLEKLPAPTEEERDRLDFDAIAPRDNSRLSCQILMSDSMDGLRVTMAPGSKKE